MKNMSLEKIAASCGGQYFGPENLKAAEAEGIVTDSRLVEPGFLFVAVKGSRVDGHSFIPSVFENGALCVLCEHAPGDPHPDRPYILVESCLESIQKIAAYYRSTLSIPVIGVSGSVGKTSTKEMISSILSQRFNVLKTEGNFNNEIGLPLTIFRIREEHEAAVLEMGINHFGEMTRLSRMAKPDICVITNIGTCHLENLIDRDGVLRAKTEMFDEAAPDARIILNGDDDKLAGVKRPAVFFGLDPKFDVYAEDITSQGLRGTSCTFVTKSGKFPVFIPVPGRHMVYNALCGAAVALALGLSPGEIRQGISSFSTIGGRNNIISHGGMEIIDDCYNANPTSVAASLDVLSHAGGRKVAILGDMGELGADAARLHRETGVKAAVYGIDLLLTVGELSEETSKRFAASSPSGTGRHFESKSELLEALPGILEAGDTVLVKASHFMGFEEIVARLVNS